MLRQLFKRCSGKALNTTDQKLNYLSSELDTLMGGIQKHSEGRFVVATSRKKKQ